MDRNTISELMALGYKLREDEPGKFHWENDETGTRSLGEFDTAQEAWEDAEVELDGADANR